MKKLTVKELAEGLGLAVVEGGEALEKTVTGGYCGDLLSWVMGRAGAGSAWITVMTNENAIAVAVLANVSCIVLADGAALGEKARQRAAENGVAVLSDASGAYELAVKIERALSGERRG